jgi:RNA polymerase sigma factor (sigma-70 family)
MAKHAPTPVSLLGRLGRNPNDSAAWREFVRYYGGTIRRWCQHWGLQQADADDVSQDLLMEVARQMQTFVYDPARSFRAWLKTLAHGAWCDWLERQNRQVQGDADSEVLRRLHTVVARDDLVQRLEQKYDAELLELAQARVRLRVGPRSWEAFRLLALERRPGAEVAAELGMRVGTAYVARSRVQKLLQEEIRKLEMGEA